MKLGIGDKAAVVFCFFAAFVLLLSACSSRTFETNSDEIHLFIHHPSNDYDAHATHAGVSKVSINHQVLRFPLDKPVQVNLVDGRQLAVIFLRRFTHANGDVSLIGYLRDFGLSYSVEVTTGRSGAFGRIQTPQGLLQIRCDANGTWLLDTQTANVRSLALTSDALIPPPNFITPRVYSKSDGRSIDGRAGPTSIVDVLILYSSELQKKYPNGALQTRLNQLETLVNKAFNQSGVDIQVRFVTRNEITIDETLTSEILLGQISQSQPPFGSVGTQRDQASADMVVLMRTFRAGANITCGVSWLNGANGAPLSENLAYSVVADGQDGSYFCDDYTIAHELAHGMGSSHDVLNADAPGAFPYSYGYGKQGVFGTIMSYFTPQAGLFSSPNLTTCFNQICGVADQADNVRSLNNVRLQVATFRTGTSVPQLAPIVTTEPATNIANNEATLNATVDAGGLATDVNFEYGTASGSLLQRSASQSVSSFAKQFSINQRITDLMCGTQYFYRVVANNVDGVSQGVERRFSTQACPVAAAPNVTTTNATNIVSNSVRLNGTINSQQQSGRYYFEYGTAATFNVKTAATTLAARSTLTTVSANVTGLACNTVYNFRLVFETSTGIVNGPTLTATTSACLTAIVPTIAEPQILLSTPDTARLSSEISTTQPLTIFFEYGTSATYGNRTADKSITTSGTATETLKGLQCGATYYVRAVAKNGSDFTYSADKTFSTAPCTPISVVTTGDALGVGVTGATLTAIIAPHADSVDVYFEYGISSVNEIRGRSQSLVMNSSTFTLNDFISGLACGATYQFRANIVVNGSTFTGSTNTFTTMACVVTTAAILTLDPADIKTDRARLRATVNAQGKPTYVYFEYGKTADYGLTTPRYSIGSPTVLREASWSISALECGSVYHFRAVVDIENSVGSSTTLTGNDVPFSTETCKPITIQETFVLWINDNSASVGVNVEANGVSSEIFLEYGATSNYGIVTATTVVSSGVATFQLTSLKCDTRYFFRAVASNPNGGVLGDQNTFTTKACAQPPTAVTESALNIEAATAVLTGRVNPNGALTNVVFDITDAAGSVRKTDPVVITKGYVEQLVSINVVGLVCETSYSYRVGASNANGVAQGEALTFTTGRCTGVVVNPTPKTQAIVAAGQSHALALDDGGRIVLWGGNEYGQLGIASNNAQRFQSLQSAQGETFTNILRAAAGARHSLALLDDGTVLAWGDNTSGQLGIGNKTSTTIPSPVLIDTSAFLTGAVDVGAGEGHSIALMGDGSVRTWGANDTGQLGNNQKAGRTQAGWVTGLSKIVAIAAGARHNLVVTNEGSLFGWGDNRLGQLGDGTTSLKLQPVSVDIDSAVTRVAAGAAHSLALTDRGEIFVWGANDQGQLGLGMNETVLRPQIVRSDGGPINGVSALAAGNSHSLALLEDGRVLAWGDNSRGQLGDGTTQSRNLPAPVLTAPGESITGVVAIAAGDRFSIALTKTGNLIAWGDNTSGQLGLADGTSSVSLFPEVVKDEQGASVSLRVPRIILDPEKPRMREGERLVLQIRLSSPPTQPIELTVVVGSNSAPVTVPQGSGKLTFDASNWDRNQQVTVQAARDENTQTDQATLVFSATGLPTLNINITVDEARRVQKPKAIGSISMVELCALLCAIWLTYAGRKSIQLRMMLTRRRNKRLFANDNTN